MNLTIRQLRYICEASREGSIQAASRKLAISQSSIVAALEAAEFALSAWPIRCSPRRMNSNAA
jgi:DNA-binding transcriptional LysR family regulator